MGCRSKRTASVILHPVLSGAAGVGAGLIVGSFIATLVLRWPEERSLGGRSACDACRRRLRPTELVPVLSYVASRGRCRTCGASIDPTHLFVELLSGVVGAVALALLAGPLGIAGALFGWQLIALAALDLRHFWLPDRLTALLAATGLIAAAVLGLDMGGHVIGGLAGFAALYGIGSAYRRVRGASGLGGGDPKLLGAIGCWTGWEALPLVLVAASLFGLLAIAIAKVRGAAISGTTRVPLGTLMAIAAFPIWLLHN